MLTYDAAAAAAAPDNALRLVEEINHRVVNEYAEAIATLSLARSQAADEQVIDALSRAAERLQEHAESHRALMPPRAEGDTNLADYVARICNAFSKATLAERDVRLALRSIDIMLPAQNCWRIGLVIVELLRNAPRGRSLFSSTWSADD
jgi:two-component sensor histidine kinase